MWVQGEPFVPYSDEERKAWGKEQRRLEKERENERLRRIANAGTPHQIDKEYQQKYVRFGVSDAHRAKLMARGLFDADIERIKPYSVGDKLYLPIPNWDGMRVGAQIKVDGRGGYTWDRAGNNRTKNHDELPIAIWGNRDNPKRVLFVEGVTFKPYIASIRNPNNLIIGVSGGNFGSCPKQIAEVLSRCPDAELVLMPDGGAVFNKHIGKQYEGLVKLLGNRPIEVGWWRQFNKSDGDIDEIAVGTGIEYLSWTQWYWKAQNGAEYHTLNSSRKIPGTLLNSQYLGDLPPIPEGTISFISSPVGTGKTEQLINLVADWDKRYPDGRIMAIGYRNGLLDQISERLGIDSFRAGYGMDDLAIASFKKLAIVADSLLRVQLTDIPAHTLLFFDEIEAVLRHCANGQTFGDRAAAIQAHLIQIIDRVLVSGGAILGLEDNVTDISIEGLIDLTNGKYPINIIKNNYERFDWDVSIGGGTNTDFARLLVARLQADERIQLSTTAQEFGEILEKLVKLILPELANKIERVDAKTIQKQRDLIAKPIEYLRSRDTRLLILSPTVESGFSLDDRGIEPLFDRVMAYFPSLDTRTHKQMLARYRSNCPRDIFIKQRGNDANNKPLSVDRYLGEIKAIANETALAQGVGKIENNARAEVWNVLSAKFNVRSNLSSSYSLEYLRHELIESGHNVNQIDWAIEADRYIAETGSDIGDITNDWRNIKEELKKDEGIALEAAPGGQSIAVATSVLRSSLSTPEQKINGRKSMLQHRLPGADLTYDFLRVCVVNDRERYLRQCELMYLIAKLGLAKAIDKLIMADRINDPHILYDRCPKNQQRAELIKPIIEAINDLSTGREYRSDDTAITSIAKYAIAKAKRFRTLFGLSIAAPSIDSTGRTQNTYTATAHKILKKLGWETRRVHQLGNGKNRISVYAIVNAKCEHRQTIYEALERKYQQTIANAELLDLKGLKATHAVFNNNISILKTACVLADGSVRSASGKVYSEDLLKFAVKDIPFLVDHPDHREHFIRTHGIELLEIASQYVSDDLRLRLKLA
jgi:hypothetical protein